uniref:SCP domain-containing protein n=1 Tax=Angiostrongylus cantonensis TaxID=6313 RepID=A0A0K0D4A8_ANGCA
MSASSYDNASSFGEHSSAFDRRFPIQSAIVQWSDISNQSWPAYNIYDGNPALFEFSNMILANTASVGCSGAMCFGSSAGACVFSSPSLVARGLAKNGEYPSENAPPASRMDLMEYDCKAEDYALNHVISCDKKQSLPLARPGYSENIHVLETTATDLLGAIQNAIASFTSELGTNGIPSNMVLSPEVLERTEKTVTKTTKVLWASNRYVACATRLCTGFYFTSCMYKDPVNMVGQSIYPIGAVCSSCPTGPNNCNPAIGLCSY